MGKYKPEDLIVIIPVGGEAKRLKPLTVGTCKACVRILNRALIEISMTILAEQGVKNFIFGVKGFLNYKDIFDYFKEGIGFSSRYSIKPRIHIKYSPNIDDVGSADSARIIMEYYDIRKPTLVIQGDNITDVDLPELLEFHCSKKAFATIGLKPVEDIEGYGVAEINSDMRISRFVEKPSKENAPSNLINTGLYFFDPAVREVYRELKVQEMITLKKRLDFGYDFIPYVVGTGRPVYGFALKNKWFDVGDPQRYLEAMNEILHGQLKHLSDFGGRISPEENIWIQGGSPESIKRRKEIIGKIRRNEIEVEDSVLIGRHCYIGNRSKIKDSCIDSFSFIGENSNISASSIMDRVRIGENVEIHNSIIGRHVDVGRSSKIISSVLADNVTVGENCSFIETKVYPHLKIPANGKYTKKSLMAQNEI